MTTALRGWKKSSYSSGEETCVEVAVSPTLAGLRDTKNRDGGELVVSPAALGAVLELVRHF